jgi:hypothetical protein
MATPPPPMSIDLNVTINGRPTYLMDRAKILCSFCRKALPEVGKMISGPGVFICDECCSLCFDIMAEAPCALFDIAERSTAALLRILGQPWKQGTWTGGRTGKETGPSITCPGCGLSTDPRDGLWLNPNFHYNLPTICPWLLAAQALGVA